MIPVKPMGFVSRASESVLVADRAQSTQLYIVDSTTGQVAASESVVGRFKHSALDVGYATGDWGAAFGGDKKDNVGLAVQDAVALAVAFLLEQLPNITWSGTVVLVKGDKIYLNRGAREGVTVGQAFTVGEVEIIRDPDAGEVLDESMMVLANLKVGTVKEKLSIASVTSGNASAVMRGMTIHQP